MALLDHLSEYADKLDKKTVCDKIWPNLVRYVPTKKVHALLTLAVTSKLASQTPWRSSAKPQSRPSSCSPTRFVHRVGQLIPSR